MLTYADVCGGQHAYTDTPVNTECGVVDRIIIRMLTYADVCGGQHAYTDTPVNTECGVVDRQLLAARDAPPEAGSSQSVFALLYQ
jgi:hypothetical protein